MIPRWVWAGAVLGAAAWFLGLRATRPAGASTLGTIRPIQPIQPMGGGGGCGL